MAHKSDLPRELQPAAASQSASNFSQQAAGSLPSFENQSVSSPPTAPSLPPNDVEIETESEDEDLPRMPDSSSEEEIENPGDIENPDDVESLPNSQPLFQYPLDENNQSNRRSLRYNLIYFLLLENCNESFVGVKLCELREDSCVENI